MVSTFWNSSEVQSKKTLEFLEQFLHPICVYDDRGQVVYASQALLTLLPNAIDDVGFFEYFASKQLTQTRLTQLWQRALQGELTEFLSKPEDAVEGVHCSLHFNSEAKLMVLSASPAIRAEPVAQLLAEYEQAIAGSTQSNLATALIDPEGIIIRGNQKLHELLGLSEQESSTIHQFVHPDDRRLDAELSQKLLEGAIQSYTIEKRLISKTRGTLWMNVNVSLIKPAVPVNGCEYYFAVLFEDITESRKIYNALVVTEEKWKALVLNSPYLFIQTNNTGQILYASPAIESILGYREEELLGRAVTEFIHPKNVNEFERMFQVWSTLQDNDQAAIECWWRVQSGRWVSLRLQGHRFPSTLGIDGIVISGHNITDRKCLEVELQASEEKFKSLVLNIPGAVFRCDSSYKMQFASGKIREITGYPASVFIHNQVRSYLSIIHPDDIPLIKDSLMQAVLDRHRCTIEYRIIHADGRVRWVSECKQGEFDSEGRLLWLDGVLLDVSEHSQAETTRGAALKL